jgi:hypothetical protein
MSDLLWQKAGVQSDQRVMRFLAGDDVLLDREFFLHDIEASKAHVEGLLRINLLTDEESQVPVCVNWMCWPPTSAPAPSCWMCASRMATRPLRLA